MTGRTHATLGAAAGAIVAGTLGADPLYCLLAGILGGLLPDIDHPQSILSGWIPGSGLLLALGRVRHRGFTHSILFAVLLVAAWFAASQRIVIPYPLVVAGLAGVATHLVSDMLTPQGIPLLYPMRFNFKAAPGVFLHIGKWFGVVEFVVWLGALAGIAFGILLIAQQRF
jgi:inner membrane protein